MNETRWDLTGREDVLGAAVRVLESLTALSDADRAAIKALPLSLRTVADRETVLRIGEVPDACIVLVSAFAYKHKTLPGGVKQILAINLPGEIINVQSALLMDADAHVTVFKSGEVALIPAQAMHELIFTSPTFARALWLYTHAEGAVAREWIVNTSRRGLVSRAAHLLCEISFRMRVALGEGEPRFHLPIGTQQLADAMAAALVPTVKALRLIEADEAIALEPDEVRILDWERLTELADFDPQYLLQDRARRVGASRSRS